MEGIAIFQKVAESNVVFSYWFWAIFIGLFVSVCINTGPSLVKLIQISLTRGFYSAAWFATGVMLNDAMVVSIAILTSIKVPESPMLFYGTGILLITFGIFTFRKKVKKPNDYTGITKDIEKKSWFQFLFKGFILNIMHPFNWLFWFSAVTVISGNMGGNKLNSAGFFAVVLVSMLAMELLKGWGASKLKKLRDSSKTKIINRIAGIVLMIIGICFLFQGAVISKKL